jgi:heptosyltransferase III
MKILIIQLARLGDILQTVPAINAIQRINPDAEIHLLVRSRFKAAADLVPHVKKIWTLDSQMIFAPLFEQNNLRETQIQARTLVRDLQNTKYSQILNLSFSPASSYLTSLLSSSDIDVRGYTRHADGFFNPNDDASSYFFAQVGVGKSNRIHITDLLAQVAGVSLASGDWYLKYKPKPSAELPAEFVAIHIGASQIEKSYSQWAKVINGIGYPVVLIGAVGERPFAEEILKTVNNKENLIDLVGRTSFTQLFDIIAQSSLLIGADSAPMAMAPFTKTKCLNLSCSTVNFWETGPRSNARVIYSDKMGDIDPIKVIAESKNILLGKDPGANVYVSSNAGIESFSFDSVKSLAENFEWELLKGLYTGGELPVVENYSTILAMTQLREVNQIIVEQTRHIIEKREPKTHADMIAQADDIISGIKKFAPKIQPLISWYEVERTRIPPGDLINIAERTLKICKGLEHVLSLYLGALSPQLRRSNENFALESLPDFE